MTSGNLPFKIDKRTPLILLLGIALLGATYWLFTRPMSNSLSETNTTNANLTKEVEVANTRAQQLQNGIDPLAALQNQVKTADSLLPPKPDPAQLALALPNIATKNNLEIIQLDPGSDQKGAAGGLFSISFTTSLSGSFQNLVSFLSDLRSSPGLYTFDNMVLDRSTSDQGGNYTMTGTTKVWYSSVAPLTTTAQNAPVPGGTAPGTAPAAPGAVTPGAPVPGGTAPGDTVPGNTAPGSTTPAAPEGATVPTS